MDRGVSLARRAGAAPSTSRPSRPVGEAEGWVRDTRFGDWLVTSEMWAEHVVRAAVRDLAHLMGRAAPACPTIVDVGCGGGKALPILEEVFAPGELIGIDPDANMIDRAGAAGARCRCRVELRLGHAAALGLPDHSVDMIFCHQTFHHAPDPPRAAREFYRVLRPGGVLLFAESCAPFIRSRLVRLLFRHPLDAQMSADGYARLLRSTGFAFTADNMSTPYPWWSRRDLGAFEWLGLSPPAQHPTTVLNLAALKPR